jgi:anti-sigma B factor antagonist
MRSNKGNKILVGSRITDYGRFSPDFRAGRGFDAQWAMSLSIQDHEVGDVTVVRVAGRLTLSDSNGAVKSAVNTLVEQGRNRFVLNLEGVPYVDSSGLGELASAHVTVSRTGATLVLAAVNDRVMEALKVTRLTRVLQVEQDEAAAVARLQQAGTP